MTICPPRDSDTALYHDLVKLGNGTLSEEDRQTLKDAVKRLFLEEAHMEYVRKMTSSSYMGNRDQILQGFHSLSKPLNSTNAFEIRMWNSNGTITTPWYGGDYVEEYKEGKEMHVVLELPDDIKDQVGSGTLIIEIEVDTREEAGWFEEITMIDYIFHPTKKPWFEAEDECRQEGGHLASMSSEEINLTIEKQASGTSVWLGGRKEFGKWTWSDNSTWGYTSWSYGQPNDGDGSCVSFFGRKWWDDRCHANHSFICQINEPLKGKNLVRLAHTGDHLNFSRMFIHYKLKPTSQQLLDSWEDKRMTGFKLSWKIENPTLIMVTSTREVGRSIQTPGLENILKIFTDVFGDHMFKSTLTIPEEVQQQMRKRKSSIELNFDIEKADGILDETYAFTSFKLYKQFMAWPEAKVHCEREGGQLASIHSQWEQTLAEQAAEGHHVWVGGRKNGNKWTWADNATWSLDKWPSKKL